MCKAFISCSIHAAEMPCTRRSSASQETCKGESQPAAQLSYSATPVEDKGTCGKVKVQQWSQAVTPSAKKGTCGKLIYGGKKANLLLNVVQHLSLGLHQHRHVQEDLVQLHQALLQLLHCLMPLIDLCQSVQHLHQNVTPG